MINYYQPFLLPFLHASPYTLRKGIQRYYYFSWEDALWDILIQKDIPLHSVILIPDFYCMDVVENIKTHGYTPIFYPLDRDLQIDPTSFAQIIQDNAPQVIIIFHAAGITSRLMKDTSWLLEANNAIIIEDCVHRLLDPADVHFLNSNHILMDSLRKDSPLPGSFLYASNNFLLYKSKPRYFTSYFLCSTLYFILFRLLLMISALIKSANLTRYAHEVILKKHDDIIGDSKDSHRGLPFVPILHRFINFKKIKKKKEEQVDLYFKEISSKETHSFFLPQISQEDYQHLHVFPLGLTKKAKKPFINYLHKHGIIIWDKFPDCPWSQSKSLLFLPLGFHVSEKEIKTTLNVIFLYGL